MLVIFEPRFVKLPARWCPKFPLALFFVVKLPPDILEKAAAAVQAPPMLRDEPGHRGLRGVVAEVDWEGGLFVPEATLPILPPAHAYRMAVAEVCGVLPTLVKDDLREELEASFVGLTGDVVKLALCLVLLVGLPAALLVCTSDPSITIGTSSVHFELTHGRDEAVLMPLAYTSADAGDPAVATTPAVAAAAAARAALRPVVALLAAPVCTQDAATATKGLCCDDVDKLYTLVAGGVLLGVPALVGTLPEPDPVCAASGLLSEVH